MTLTHTRTRTLALALALPLAGIGLLAPATSYAAPAGCEGRVATHVGAPEVAEITGTAGPDVIVTNGSGTVRALGGDDLICVTGTAAGSVRVLSGAGDDRVQASDDAVGAGLVVRTGAGDDRVEVDGPAVVDAQLGDGDDRVRFVGFPLPGSRVDGGRGADLFRGSGPKQLASLDLGRGTLVHGRARTAVDVPGFKHAKVASTRVVLRGTAGPNQLIAYACSSRILGLGGDDVLAHDRNWVGGDMYRCAHRSTILGGPGDDTIRGSTGRGGRDRLHGGPGNDRLAGRKGADVVIGGPGRDRASGGYGVDVCRAERTVTCER